MYQIKKLFFVLLFIFYLVTLFSYSCLIQIDASGSMRGYANTGALRKHIAELTNILETYDIAYSLETFKSFNTESIEFNKINEEDLDNSNIFNGQHTLLDKSIKFNTEALFSIIVTDNIYDGDYEKNTENFYNSLINEPKFLEIKVIPKIIPFRGWVFLPGMTRQFHNGEAGLISYIVLYDHKQDYTKYDSFVKGVEDDPHLDIFHIRPIDGSNFEINALHDDFLFELNPATKQYNFKYRSQLRPVMKSNRAFPLSLTFNLRSMYRHVVLEKGTEVEVSNIKLFNTTQNEYVPVVINRSFISPTEIPETLKYHGNQMFNIDIVFTPVIDDLSQEITLFTRRDRFVLDFDLVIKNRNDKLQLSPEMFKKYFTKDISVRDKIYSSVDPISYFNTGDSRIVLNFSNKNSPAEPESLLSLKTGKEALFIFVILAFVILMIVLGLFIKSFISVKDVYVFIGEEEPVLLKAMSSKIINRFNFKNGQGGINLVINDRDYYYGNLRKTSVILIPEKEYIIESDTKEEISITVKRRKNV